MKISLKSIKKPFELELQEYEKVFKEIMTSNISLVDIVVKYIVKHKGKGLRPLLVLMSAKLVGDVNHQTYTVASVVELLHTASLVHDDVVDEAKTRRGFPSINSVWKNKIAVLMGDYLLSKCLIGATDTGKLEVMSILANASKRLSKGELLQIEKSRKMNINEEDYFHIISDKTAALISAASQLGALTVSDKKEDHENLKLFGENLGMAFQIKDDLLDYNGHQNIIGKPVGNDFEDKKITLPLLIAFRSAEDKQIKRIKKMLKKGVDKKGKNLIIDFVNQYDGINTSEKMCQEYANKAKENIANYPDSDVKTALYDLSDYVVSRKK